MRQIKTEVILEGEFTTIDVSLEGKEISLREVEDNQFRKLFNGLEIEEDLDIHVRLKGFITMEWSIKVIIEDKEAFLKKGTFDSKGFITFTESIGIK